MTPPAPSVLRFAVRSGAAIAALYLGTLLLCRSGVIADGYDGVGFVLAVERFDLARFAPQPPGYPLFVLAGRALHGLGLPPALALATTNALLLAAGLGALAGLLRVALGQRTGLLFLLLVPTAPLSYGLGMATLSDGAGLGMLLITGVTAAVALRESASGRARHLLVGLLGGLTLGLRPPLLPLLTLVLAMLYGAALRRRAIGAWAVVALFCGLAATVLLWLLPFSWVVGPRALLRLSLAHARGHFTDFGGSAFVQPQPLARLQAFLTGLGQGGLGHFGWLLLPIAALQVRRLGRYRAALVAVAGYALWVGVSAPLTANGRHLLPLAVLLSTLVAVGLSVDRLRPGLRWALLGLATLVAVDNGRAVWTFRKTPPPGAALAGFVADTAASLRLYGARGARYLDLHFGSGSARPAVYLGEVLADLAHADQLPAEVLVTSEVLASPSSLPRLRPLARFCYPDAVPTVLRFDRAPSVGTGAIRGDCIELLSYRVRP